MHRRMRIQIAGAALALGASLAPAAPGLAGPMTEAALHPAAPPAPTAEALSGDPAEVLAVIDRLFDGMRARDGAMVRSAFHPDARMFTTRVTDDGIPEANPSSVDAFVEAVDGGGDPWDEPYFDPVVQVDGALAQVWIFYRFYAGTTFSHCGHNAIQLLRHPDRGWEIVHLVDTRRTTDCEAPA